MILTIKNDLYRWYGKKKLTLFEKIRANNIPQIKFMLKKRKIDYYREKDKVLFLFHMLGYNKLKIKYGIDLPARVKMGEGIIIEHIGGIVINPQVTFGNNINIYNGVTIGVEKRGKREGVPKIGNQVWIGANAIIVGKIEINDNVLIAPGAYVNFDVPSGSIVVGNPGKIIHNQNATDIYIANTIEGV